MQHSFKTVFHTHTLILGQKKISSPKCSLTVAFLVIVLLNTTAFGFLNKYNPDTLYGRATARYRAKQYTEAYSLYREAERRGSKKAYHGIALCFQEGVGVDENIDSAIHYYRKIVSHDSTGSYNLAKIYEYRDALDSAKKYYHIAVKGGMCGDDALRRVQNKRLLKDGNKKRIKKEEPSVSLSAFVTDTNLILCTKNGPLIGIFFKEIHNYIKAYDPIYRCSSPHRDSLPNIEGIQFTVYDRVKSNLMALELEYYPSSHKKSCTKGVYRVRDSVVNGIEQNVMEYITRGLGDKENPFMPLTLADIKKGERFYTCTSFDSPVQRRVDISDTVWARHVIKVTPDMLTSGEFKEMDLSGCDLLKDILLEVRALNAQAIDIDDFHIAYENTVSHDRVALIMDILNSIGFANLSWEKSDSSSCSGRMTSK